MGTVNESTDYACVSSTARDLVHGHCEYGMNIHIKDQHNSLKFLIHPLVVLCTHSTHW